MTSGSTKTTGLDVQGITFAVGKKVIVDGVDLAIAPGETVAILGPSGCGKTSLLRLISGLERAQSGHVRFDGETINDVPAHRRGFGMMFQDFALFPHLDVAQNVAFGLRGRQSDKRAKRARVDGLLETVGLSGFGKRRVDALSGGEQQRVALARAIAPEPRLLMFDEPLGSLDRGLREHLLVELKAVLDRLSIPAIYVTHDQFEAFAIADRLAIMHEGRFVREGAPRDVYADPQTEFVARFLGFDNIVDGVSDGNIVETAAGRWELPSQPGRVRLLLRNDGVAVVEGGGQRPSGVVVGRLATVAFRGAMNRIGVDVGEISLSFDIAASCELPPVGEPIRLRVPEVELLR